MSSAEEEGSWASAKAATAHQVEPLPRVEYHRRIFTCPPSQPGLVRPISSMERGEGEGEESGEGQRTAELSPPRLPFPSLSSPVCYSLERGAVPVTIPRKGLWFSQPNGVT